MLLLVIVYIVTSVILFIFGFNAFFLIWLRMTHKKGPPPCPPLDEYPIVTIQLPIYNERFVVSRAIDTIAQLDWPRESLEIQILDDSTDDTTQIAQQCAQGFQEQGIQMVVIHRVQRAGFKAGALNDGLRNAKGSLVAIFDADFCPPPDFLKRTIPYLLADPKLGFIQTRWAHLNDEASLFTLAQAVALDGHFVVEHIAREAAGLLTNFSGTGGIWRRRCIEECGGWDGGMLTEDVDLSYRAQLLGWTGMTLQDVSVPAELPALLAAFMQQQFRWAKGNTQCFLKLVKPLLRAPLSWRARIQGLIHLGYYFAHPLMLIVMGVTFPLIWYDLLHSWVLALLSLATLGPPSLYVLGQRILYRRWWRRLRAIPILVLIGTGMAFSSTVAVIEALLGIKSAFQRTPKFHTDRRHIGWQGQPYAPAKKLPWGELLALCYAALTIVAAVSRNHPAIVPFLLLYVLGFGYTIVLRLGQSASRA